MTNSFSDIKKSIVQWRRDRTSMIIHEAQAYLETSETSMMEPSGENS